MKLSGNLSTWSKGFDTARTSRLYLYAVGAGLSAATHVATVTTAAPTLSTDLCKLNFSKPTALPKMPVVSNGAYSGVLDPILLHYLLAGGLFNGSMELILTYGAATALTTIDMSFAPDPATGLYPSTLHYELEVGGVVKASSNIVPSAAGLSLSISASATVVKLRFTAPTPIIIGDLLPKGTAQTAALVATMDGAVLDVQYGNRIALSSISVLTDVGMVAPITLSPSF